MGNGRFSFRWSWISALAFFTLAAATGAFMRFGLIFGFPFDLQFGNVRHAHSHLMYFGWVTPALMGLIAARLPQVIDKPLSSRFRWPIIFALGAALLAYMPFILYGYRSAEIGTNRLPLSVLAAGLNIVSWYLFMWQYWRETRGEPRNYPLQLWDAALIFLFLAGLGAWGLPVLTFGNIQSPFWSQAFTHIFLDLFAYGWFLLAVLGLAYTAYPQLAANQMARTSNYLMIIGLPVIFLLGMPAHVVPPALRWLGGLGGLLVALGILGHLRVLWPLVKNGWRVPLIFVGLTAVSILISIIPAAAQWALLMSLRVPFLHWLLLGFVSLGLFSAAVECWGATAVPGQKWMTGAVLLLIFGLIPLSGLWPAALRGEWTRYFAALTALGPALVSLGILFSYVFRYLFSQAGSSLPQQSSS